MPLEWEPECNLQVVASSFAAMAIVFDVTIEVGLDVNDAAIPKERRGVEC
jgi:hypothetical protein